MHMQFLVQVTAVNKLVAEPILPNQTYQPSHATNTQQTSHGTVSRLGNQCRWTWVTQVSSVISILLALR